MSTAMIRSNRAIPLVVSLIALLIGSGCSVTGGTKSPANLPSGPSTLGGGQQVGEVVVSLNQELPADLTQVLEAYEVVRILDNRVREQLESRGMTSDGTLEVDVEIIGMRLRSNGTAIWWGFFAGGDWITVDVEVKQGGRSIKQFQTGTSTALGGFIFGGRSTRVGRMMKTLAERIAEHIVEVIKDEEKPKS